MNKLHSNHLNVIVCLHYGIGFDFVVGQIEIEISVLNKTQTIRILSATQNRINLNEKCVWNVDKAKLESYRTTNGFVKIECFKTPVTNHWFQKIYA